MEECKCSYSVKCGNFSLDISGTSDFIEQEREGNKDIIQAIITAENCSLIEKIVGQPMCQHLDVKQSNVIGTTITHGNIDWIVLDKTEKGYLCISKDILFEKAFDEENSCNWNESTLRNYLNSTFLDDLTNNGANTDDFLEIESDLTADDGINTYGSSTDKIALITCQQYRKYRNLISNVDDWWWTITPWSASYSHLVRSVYPSGALNVDGACSGSIGVRPLCNLVSSIVES